MTIQHADVLWLLCPVHFSESLIALTPDSVTGKPSPDKFKAFMARHADKRGQASLLGADKRL